MAFKPSEEGEFPTLGWAALDWMMSELASPKGGTEKDPFVPYPEQAKFILHWYRLDPVTGRRVYRRGGLCRPRGWGKSPLLASICAVEALGPVVFDGWDAAGQPVGRPWSRSTNPLIEIGAVSEDQADVNTWSPLLEMLRNGPVVDDYPGLEPFDTIVNLPDAGSIRKITASAGTVKGAPAQLAILDQTEEWRRSNGGVRLAGVLRDNAAKVNGRTLESPNAFVPGERSIAETSYLYARKIAEHDSRGTGSSLDPGLLWDDREAPDVDLADQDKLILALRYVYGDSALVEHEDGTVTGHVNLDRLVAEARDPERSPESYKREFLNQKISAGDAFVHEREWAACGPHEDDPLWPDWEPPEPVTARDAVVLGFDGSRRRKNGVADATALVAVRVSDGLAWPVHVWEEPDGPESVDWEVPESDVEAVLSEFMDTHRVVGFKADQAYWESNVARWEAKYGARMKVGGRSQHPIAVNTRMETRPTARGIQALATAIRGRELKHLGVSVLTRHVLNAVVRERSYGPLLFKKTPSSSDKIDACYALMLAWRARLDALSMDLTEDEEPQASFVPSRIW